MTADKIYFNLTVERAIRLHNIAESLGRKSMLLGDALEAFLENAEDDGEIEAYFYKGNLSHEMDLWDLQAYEEEERANH